MYSTTYLVGSLRIEIFRFTFGGKVSKNDKQCGAAPYQQGLIGAAAIQHDVIRTKATPLVPSLH